MRAATLLLAATHTPAPCVRRVGTRAVLDALLSVNVAAVALVEAVFPGPAAAPSLAGSEAAILALGAALDALDAATTARDAGLGLPLDADPPDAATLWALADEGKAVMRQLHKYADHKRKRWPGTHWRNLSTETLRRINALVSP